jgi:hypothetical protein
MSKISKIVDAFNWQNERISSFLIRRQKQKTPVNIEL